ncbi:NAD(P)-dependent oxidoreductase [Brevibacterium zhoupengii]|uniref:NAD(P)-dependent oxidoreductase n=1 Tax=Brevibacterium zhoupengii TaxID=2898795 RepID=UPI001E4C8DFD|nr:NAD(P)-dependent oxidoreductase [Brevibacterium zhoupengii]
MATTLFIGLGRMGAPMAALHAKTFTTAVFDLSNEATAQVVEEGGAIPVTDLSSLPAGIDTVILMLPSSRQVEDTLTGDNGLLRSLSEGTLIIDMGSSEPTSTQDLARQAQELGVDYVDAPVSGGVPKARTGELSILVGGTDEAVAKARPHLEVMGTTIIHVGNEGAGDAAKAINNLVSATNIAVACEALTMADDFGIEPTKMAEVLNSATGRSQASELKVTKYILPQNFTSGFAYDLMLKDMTIAMGLAHSLETPVTDVAFDKLNTGRADLGDTPDHTEISRLYGLDR